MGSRLRQEIHAVPSFPPAALKTGLVRGRNEPLRSTHKLVVAATAGGENRALEYFPAQALSGS